MIPYLNRIIGGMPYEQNTVLESAFCEELTREKIWKRGSPAISP
jgi:hypothetical protein